MNHVMLNGKLVSPEMAVLPLADRGLLLADGLFETCRAECGKVLCFSAHIKRLRGGAEYMQIPLPYTEEVLLEQCQQVLSHNGLLDVTAAIRITLTRGVGARGVAPPVNPSPTIFITAAEYHRPHKPAHVIVAKHPWSKSPPLSHFKTLNYQDSIIGRLEAQQAGADDAIMCTPSGQIVCTTTANIFLKIYGVWVTPPISDGALPGIERAKLLKQAQADGTPIKVKSIHKSELKRCDEAFMTNSLLGRREISKLG